LLTVLLAGPAAAQTQQPDRAGEGADTTRSTTDSVVRAAAAASAALADPACPAVTFDDILGAPDDIALNVCFARAQIAAGNVTGAAATLERILLIAPDAVDIRLLYGIVLYRLDSIDAAEAELRAVTAQPVPPDVRAQIDDLLAKIERRRSPVKQSIAVTFGPYYDTNRNAAPSSGLLSAAGAETAITNKEDRENDDFGLIGLVGYDVTYDPGLQDQHEIFAGADFYSEFLKDQKHLDVTSMAFDAGVRLRYPNWTVTPRIYVQQLTLQHQHYLLTKGAEVRVDHKPRIWGLDDALPPTNLFGSFALQHEDFDNTDRFQSLVLRKGRRYVTKAGVEMALTPDHRIAVTGAVTVKNAARDPNNGGARIYSFKGYEVEASHTWILGGGQFLTNAVMIGQRDYKAPDTLIVGGSGTRNREEPFRYRITYGVPLTSLVGNDIHDQLDGFTLLAAGEYFRQDSNVTNYNYDKVRTQVMLTKTFEF
jgi:hypothetical protein